MTTIASPLGTIAKLVSVFDESKLLRWALQAEAAHLLPKERVSYCLRRPTVENVQMLHDPNHDCYRYGALMTCGSVWNCPLCGAKITERRREEMSTATRVLDDAETVMCMQTYTFSHKRFDNLSASLQSFLAARKRVKEGWTYQKMKKKHGIIGTISALEVTWSPRNGWHPHMHELIIFEKGVDLAAYEADARGKWTNALKLEMLTANRHGYRLDRTRGGVEDYIAKWGHEPTKPVWGPEAEFTKGHVKQSRNEKGKTAFGLLADSLDGDQEAGRLFVEFATYFKGKQQLRWSKGLKARVGLVDKSDEEIAAEDREDASIFGLFTRDMWRVVLANDVRGELLQVAKRNGLWSDVEQFLRELGAEC